MGVSNMKDKYKILLLGIFFIFIFSAIDAYQDMWFGKNIFKSTFNIFLVTFFACLPAYASFLISKYNQNSATKFNFFLLSSILTIVSLVAWLAGIISGKAPIASGAQQMHLVFWPILIPIISLIIFVVLLVSLRGYRYLNESI